VPLPGGNHGWMHTEATGQLGGGLLVLNRRQGYFGFSSIGLLA
jgi:hypothetical protein